MREKKRYILARIEPPIPDPDPKELYFAVLESVTSLFGDSAAARMMPVVITCGAGYAQIGLEAGTYLALLSHSGSRGTGAAVCDHYSKLAFSQFPDLPSELKRLAWLSLDSQEGQEYWAAMELMGRYAAANHALIHKHVAANLGAEVLLDLENHHNFAWKEKHVINGVEKEVIVHRKGATPAGEGDLGIIPGSMASPGFQPCACFASYFDSLM